MNCYWTSQSPLRKTGGSSATNPPASFQAYVRIQVPARLGESAQASTELESSVIAPCANSDAIYNVACDAALCSQGFATRSGNQNCSLPFLSNRSPNSSNHYWPRVGVPSRLRSIQMYSSRSAVRMTQERPSRRSVMSTNRQTTGKPPVLHLQRSFWFEPFNKPACI